MFQTLFNLLSNSNSKNIGRNNNISEDSINTSSTQSNNNTSWNLGTIISISVTLIMVFHLLFSEQLHGLYKVETTVSWLSKIGVEGILLLSIILIILLSIFSQFLHQLGVPGGIYRTFIYVCYIFPIKQIFDVVKTIYF